MIIAVKLKFLSVSNCFIVSFCKRGFNCFIYSSKYTVMSKKKNQRKSFKHFYNENIKNKQTYKYSKLYASAKF